MLKNTLAGSIWTVYTLIVIPTGPYIHGHSGMYRSDRSDRTRSTVLQIGRLQILTYSYQMFWGICMVLIQAFPAYVMQSVRLPLGTTSHQYCRWGYRSFRSHKYQEQMIYLPLKVSRSWRLFFVVLVPHKPISNHRTGLQLTLEWKNAPGEEKKESQKWESKICPMCVNLLTPPVTNAFQCLAGSLSYFLSSSH